MKKVIKYFLITFASLISLFVGFVVFVYFSYKEDTVIDLPINHKDGRPFIIPVEIKGKTYPFVWDTGAETSAIDYKLASELGYQGKREKYLTISGVSHVVADTFAYDSLLIRIGNIELKEHFILDGYRTYFVKGYSGTTCSTSPDGFVGIIGQNIISRYRWLFDFKEKKLKMANHELTVSQEPGDSIVKFNLIQSASTGGVPQIDLCVNKLDTFRFNFDTGYITTVYSVSDRWQRFNHCFVFSDSLLAFIRKHTIGIAREWTADSQVAAMWMDTLQLNETIISPAFSGRNTRHRHRDTVNYITSSFPYRFRLMYYNPKKQEVSFYVSPQDSAFIHRGEDEKRFFNSLNTFEKSDKYNTE